MTSYEIEPPPEGKRRGLLHSCCAPCAGEVMEAMSNAGLGYSIFFYNPNIHPRDEYEVRKQENIRFAGQKGIEFIDADYDSDNWFARVKGLEWEPERGARCTACFDMRFERSALYAVENGFDVFTSCLGISRWKNMEQINGCGQRAATRWPGLHYWTYNWRKKGGASRMQEISKREQFYQQEYCGELDAKDALRMIAAHAESGGERGAIRADHALFASHFKLRPSHAHAFLEGVGMFGGMNPKIESPRRHFLRSNADEALTRLFRL